MVNLIHLKFVQSVSILLFGLEFCRVGDIDSFITGEGRTWPIDSANTGTSGHGP